MLIWIIGHHGGADSINPHWFSAIYYATQSDFSPWDFSTHFLLFFEKQKLCLNLKCGLSKSRTEAQYLDWRRNRIQELLWGQLQNVIWEHGISSGLDQWPICIQHQQACLWANQGCGWCPPWICLPHCSTRIIVCDTEFHYLHTTQNHCVATLCVWPLCPGSSVEGIVMFRQTGTT